MTDQTSTQMWATIGTALVVVGGIIRSTLSDKRAEKQRGASYLLQTKTAYELSPNGGDPVNGTLGDKVNGLVASNAEQTKIQKELIQAQRAHSILFTVLRNSMNFMLRDHVSRRWTPQELQIIRSTPAQPAVVVVVDDEPDARLLFSAILKDEFTVITVESAERALQVLEDAENEQQEVAVVVTDQQMPGMKGTELLERLYEDHPAPIRLLITAHDNIKALEDAINEGHAYKYLKKPWGDNENLLKEVREAAANYRFLHAHARRLDQTARAEAQETEKQGTEKQRAESQGAENYA